VCDDPRLSFSSSFLSVHFGSTVLLTYNSTSYETIPHVRLETSGDVLSTVDMVVQRRDGSRWLRELDDDDDFNSTTVPFKYKITIEH